VGLFIHESQHSGEQPNHYTRFSQQTTNFHLVESLHHTRYHLQQSFFNALTLDEARSLKDGFVSVNNGRLSTSELRVVGNLGLMPTCTHAKMSMINGKSKAS
jgi:hypothetical protein